MEPGPWPRCGHRFAARRLDRDVHAARVLLVRVGRDALLADVVDQSVAANLVLAVRQPRVAGEPHRARLDVVLDRLRRGRARAGPCPSAVCSKDAGTPVMTARTMSLLRNVTRASVDDELAVGHEDLHVAREVPLGVVEIEPGRARFARPSTCIVALRDLHAPEDAASCSCSRSPRTPPRRSIGSSALPARDGRSAPRRRRCRAAAPCRAAMRRPEAIRVVKCPLTFDSSRSVPAFKSTRRPRPRSSCVPKRIATGSAVWMKFGSPCRRSAGR